MRGKMAMVAALGAALAGPGTAHATIDAAFLSPFMAMPAPDTSADAASLGEFGQPFVEPTIGDRPTDQKCITEDGSDRPANPALGPPGDARYLDCKPTAASVNVLPDGRIMYYDGLEGTEQVRTSIVIEYGHNAGNDQSRVLRLGGNPSWTVPGHPDGGANPGGYDNQALFPPPLSDADPSNDGALFCSDNKFLPDGRVIALGGTAYYTDPGVGANGSNYGVTELEGVRNSRIFDPTGNGGRGDWAQSGAMQYGRWYPTAVTLPSGRLLVASGVTKLLKPAYPDHPADSGTNVTETETYDPKTGKWTTNLPSGSRDLPLFPRLHVLPDGKVFYNAAGQSFNPAGQSYGEASWNEAAVYDPRAQEWTELGIPGLEGQPGAPDPSDLGDPAADVQGKGIPGLGPSMTIPGFRGSTFSIMLPLTPGDGYAKASFLTAGGVLNPPSPGSYLATSDSRITTVDTARGDLMSTRPTGDLAEPRWYASGVLLPTGQVLAFNGSDRDEVAGPGFEFPVQKTELFDPATNRWTTLASSHQPRTYHNTAVLLPDATVLVGGHAPISTLYANDTTVPGGFAPHDGRDPSFEIYKPPYLFDGPRPQIVNDAQDLKGLGYGRTFHVNVDVDASKIETAVLVRNPSVTHLIDADQRNVVLPITARNGHDLAVTAPPNANVAPPGPYMLFVTVRGQHGLVPSRAAQAFVGLSSVQ